MNVATPKKLTATEFLDWALDQHEGERYELVAGKPVAMAAERAAHALVKAAIWSGLNEAIRASKLPCQAFPDGMSVIVDQYTVYEPDALVQCDAPIDEDAISVLSPIIVVEVVSPSTRATDTGAKLEDYFRLESVAHYLIAKTKTRSIIHHQRGSGDEIVTSIVKAGHLVLDPPGIELDIGEVFAGLERMGNEL